MRSPRNMRNDAPAEDRRRVPPVRPDRVKVATAELGPERRCRVVHFGMVLGSTNLEMPLAEHPMAAGFFIPTKEYALVERVFQLYDLGDSDHPGILGRYLRERDALDLRLVDSGTDVLDAKINLVR